MATSFTYFLREGKHEYNHLHKLQFTILQFIYLLNSHFQFIYKHTHRNIPRSYKVEPFHHGIMKDYS